jgi:hypothetical protein
VSRDFSFECEERVEAGEGILAVVECGESAGEGRREEKVEELTLTHRRPPEGTRLSLSPLREPEGPKARNAGGLVSFFSASERVFLDRDGEMPAVCVVLRKQLASGRGSGGGGKGEDEKGSRERG